LHPIIKGGELKAIIDGKTIRYLSKAFFSHPESHSKAFRASGQLRLPSESHRRENCFMKLFLPFLYFVDKKTLELHDNMAYVSIQKKG
jgi:hypothetical protein